MVVSDIDAVPGLPIAAVALDVARISLPVQGPEFAHFILSQACQPEASSLSHERSASRNVSIWFCRRDGLKIGKDSDSYGTSNNSTMLCL